MGGKWAETELLQVFSPKSMEKKVYQHQCANDQVMHSRVVQKFVFWCKSCLDLFGVQIALV